MKKKTSNNILLPVILILFCFTFTKTPTVLPIDLNKSVSDIIPLSDMDGDFNTDDN